MRAELAHVPEWGLYQLTLHSGDQVAWLLLEPDEAHTLQVMVHDLDPDLSTLTFADLCALARCVTGDPHDPATDPPDLRP